MILTGDIITPRSGCDCNFSEGKLYKVLSRMQLNYYDRDPSYYIELKDDNGKIVTVSEDDFRPVSATELWDYFVEGTPIKVWGRYLVERE